MPIAETVAAIQRSGGIVSVKDASGKDLIKSDERVYYTQPQFFEIFDVKWIFGTPGQTLSSPDQVGVSSSFAKDSLELLITPSVRQFILIRRR